MTDPTNLSRRERQIMDAVFGLGEATVLQIQQQIPSAPSTMAIRRMLSILEEKGYLKRRKQGREYIYAPRQNRKRAARSALQHVLDTFFSGSVSNALASHLADPKTQLSDEDVARLTELIEANRKKEE